MRTGSFSKYRINPFESNEVQYWTRKWGITVYDLNRAIMETGSIEIKQLTENLKSRKIIRVNRLVDYVSHLYRQLV